MINIRGERQASSLGRFILSGLETLQASKEILTKWRRDKFCPARNRTKIYYGNNYYTNILFSFLHSSFWGSIIPFGITPNLVTIIIINIGCLVHESNITAERSCAHEIVFFFKEKANTDNFQYGIYHLAENSFLKNNSVTRDYTAIYGIAETVTVEIRARASAI
jgi:hypothetical protein